MYHPCSEDLAFLYGTILTDGKEEYSPEATANMCVFAEAQVRHSIIQERFGRFARAPQRSKSESKAVCWFSQVDRSPTGSGVTARVALQYHKGLIQMNQTRTFQSGATGSQFTGKAVQVNRLYGRCAFALAPSSGLT